MLLPKQYVERVYAGILGKLIGVYLGRPFEGWTHDQIVKELGPIWYYVHDRFNQPLVVTDDDVSGTFTFVRALLDNNETQETTSEQVGRTWLNYLVEGKTVLWWGGLGNSTEHTAFIRLKEGVPAPRSGSIELNGATVAEQIGAQIFIDSWAMVAPGNPELAVRLAREAARVSHDGEAVFAAQLLAAMESQAFIEPDIERLLDLGVSMIPKESLIRRLVDDLRSWVASDRDWEKSRTRIEEKYGYQKFKGNCHVVPNHAVVILSLLYAEDDFQQALMIANTCGWDTDCNAGNVGCLMGIKNGLAGIDAGPDWRGPLADRMLISSADGGRSVTDAVRETFEIVRIGAALAGVPEPRAPKKGARFHFELPGSTQGFTSETSFDSNGTTRIENVEGLSRNGERSLAIHYQGLAPGRFARVSTPTFMSLEEAAMSHYYFMATPTLWPGQTVEASLNAANSNGCEARCILILSYYDGEDQIRHIEGPELSLQPGQSGELEWKINQPHGLPIVRIGFRIDSIGAGTIHLDYLTWKGEPETKLGRPSGTGKMWRRIWVNAVDHLGVRWPETFHLSQNNSTGLYLTGTRDWKNFRVEAVITPRLAVSFGLAARVQGLKRYYQLQLQSGNRVRLVKRLHDEIILAEQAFSWECERDYLFQLEVNGSRIKASIDERLIFDVQDETKTLIDGGIAYVVEEGLITSKQISVSPLT
jgi:ADP-ribosylglycohydrolase